ncbi:MAG TPA: BNR-4 repeat-containing protein [Tepidisphaeraceae bacterium]|nr:BNR-4 repeat-containing protein [Tepidisphaeraceae bacterium]
MGLRRLVQLMLVVTLTCALAAAAGSPDALPKADGYQGIWYFNTRTNDAYKFKYSGGFATYPQQHIPIAIYAKEVNKTFFVFGGTTDPANHKPELLHMVAYFDHATGMVPRPRILLNKHTDDAHDNPTLSIDDQGYLYVFSNAHGTGRPSYIHRSRKPYDIDAFDKVYEGNFSYGQPWHVPGQGFILLHTHYQHGANGSTNDHDLFWMTSPDGGTWTDRQPLAAIGHGHYQISWRDPHNPNRIATAFDFHPGGLDTRTNIYFLQTTDLGRTWKTIDGRPVTPPMTQEKNPALVHDYHSEKLNVYLKDLNFDAEDHPVILYLTSKGPKPGPANAPYQWSTARWTGSEWEIRPFTTSDHNYDHGSLYLQTDPSTGKEKWTVIAPTDPGPQPFATGGEMVVWSSADQGRTWTKIRVLTRQSEKSQTYLRRPLDANPGFWGIWADGNAFAPSECSLYFTDEAAEHVWRLPTHMTSDLARPEQVR